MGITLFSQIDRYTLEGAKVELFYHLQLADGSYEEVPMGIFEVSEANRHIKTLELKAYDYMLRFEKNFNGFETVGTAYDFLILCSKACDVELAQTKEQIDEFPNADITLSIYSENDIETYRDVLYYTAQVLGCFCCITREGKLELRKYDSEPSGQSMAAAPAWDGKIIIEETAPIFKIGGGFAARFFTETIHTEIMELVQRSYTDKVAKRTRINSRWSLSPAQAWMWKDKIILTVSTLQKCRVLSFELKKSITSIRKSSYSY